MNSAALFNWNFLLQQAIEELHRNCIERTIAWLAAFAFFSTLLLAGICFEVTWLCVYAWLNIIVCAVAVYFMQDIPKELQ